MYLVWFYSKKNLYKLNKFEYYKNSFFDLQKKWINVIYFYKEDKDIYLDQVIIENINNMWIKIIPFHNELEIVDNLSKLDWKIFINTFEEQEIRLVNQIRLNLNQKTTDNPEIFLNKYLQRSIIWQKYPETTIDYRLLSVDELINLPRDDIKRYPYIMKPTWGIQSSGVSKIDNYEDYKNWIEYTLHSINKLKEKKLADQKILLEEFIDGEMYTIDYYVDEKQKIYSSMPVMVKLWTDYWINDFCNIVRIISNDVENSVDEKKLNEFIKKTVDAGNIKNTFVHHEFKINSKWEYKTIETNWRIWWFRLDMYQLWYETNLLSLPFLNDIKSHKLEYNIAVFALYPKKRAIFNWYNENIVEEIKLLGSFYRINKWEKKIWEEIWLTRDGYSKTWSIILKNNNYEQFKKDFDFIEKIYFEIMKID